MTVIPSWWRNNLIDALRERGADADMIGSALTHVEAHCVDSGQSVDDAFGDPRVYASTIARTDHRRRTKLAAVLFVVGQTVFLLALSVLFVNLGHRQKTMPSTIHWGLGAVIALALCAAAMCLPLVRRGGLSRAQNIWVTSGVALVALMIWRTVSLPLGVTDYRTTMWVCAGLVVTTAALLSLLARRSVPKDPLTGKVSARDQWGALFWVFISVSVLVQVILRLH